MRACVFVVEDTQSDLRHIQQSSETRRTGQTTRESLWRETAQSRSAKLRKAAIKAFEKDISKSRLLSEETLYFENKHTISVRL